MKLKEIIDLVGGSIAGDEEFEIEGASGLEFAGSTDITFVSEAKHLPELSKSRAGAVFVKEQTDTGKIQIVHPNPGLAFAQILTHFNPTETPAPGVHPNANLDDKVTLGTDVTLCANVSVGKDSIIGDRTVLYPGVVLGERCQIGSDTIIYPNTVLYRETEIGNHVILHAGSVIGADGFSYTQDEKGRHVKIQQIGKVVIEDHVEIGANTCIDRAAFCETIIREGVKIDNLVQIGHNCEVGSHSVIVSQTGLSGSCRLGKHNIVAGQSGISDHVTLGDQVTLMARTGVFRDIPESGTYGWAPAMKIVELMRFMPTLLRLPQLASQVKEMERRLDAIEKP
ncbi:MAG: UDP-3-O-(3-hydroxymyristoyl)glucosamine N-acyltransferase [Candidatus Nitronauta litoralis]|uniref:UDP-3-O-acylglucosamine N-acyltransferase n=1 Tax=Candidatus Nitronauta litoralis TaxID=2705533 RepID=A0A7T0BTH9_9BACT|nr:MAG: UDP-3-O-(3-hydroxymyristoyl)glucosamine N-acyltransferase [Candidatus Nitronauta litoralis]